MSDEMGALLAKIGKENRETEAKSKAPTKTETLEQAEFLRGWCKGKPIVRQFADSTFWRAGKWMTKLTFKQAEALVKAGYATLEGDAKKAGAKLTMVKR